jgi:hypothetical protein
MDGFGCKQLEQIAESFLYHFSLYCEAVALTDGGAASLQWFYTTSSITLLRLLAPVTNVWP